MKLTNRQLTKALRKLAKLNSEAHAVGAIISAHSQAVYGHEPGEVDNDIFVDNCDGGCGASDGMTAEEFDASM